MRRHQSPFQFKQFSVYHNRCTMKVGTDGVLLGAWTNVETATTILDIGTGSGIIALMLAQRTPSSTQIDAVEIETEAAAQANENVQLCPWKEKIKIHHSAIQDFHTAQKFDLIVSNPPYFQNSFQPLDEKRLNARHTVILNFKELIDAVKRLLNFEGRFNVILPEQEGLTFIALAKHNNLYCTRQWQFKTRKSKPIERWLLEFSFQEQLKEDGEMVLYGGDGDVWTDGYINLTKDFYLKL